MMDPFGTMCAYHEMTYGRPFVNCPRCGGDDDER